MVSGSCLLSLSFPSSPLASSRKLYPSILYDPSHRRSKDLCNTGGWLLELMEALGQVIHANNLLFVH